MRVGAPGQHQQDEVTIAGNLAPAAPAPRGQFALLSINSALSFPNVLRHLPHLILCLHPFQRKYSLWPSSPSQQRNVGPCILSPAVVASSGHKDPVPSFQAATIRPESEVASPLVHLLSWSLHTSRSGEEGTEPPSTVSALRVHRPGAHGVHPADETVLGRAARTSALHGSHL